MSGTSTRNILHVVGSLDRAWGGLSLYVAELASTLSDQGHQVRVVCPPSNPVEWWPTGTAEVIPTASRSLRWKSALNAADVVHVHGLWLPYYHQALAGARIRSKPYVLSVHGMLEPGALRFSRWKKRLAWWFYQRRDLRRAPALHATALPEVRTLRTLGLKQPVVTLPPGVSLPPMERNTLRAGPLRHALFLGRIHPKKGILSLVDAWAVLKPVGWQLDLGGPDEANHLANVRAKLREKRLERDVTYHGPVFGRAKDELLRKASLLIVPSVSENFGIVVAEGLAHGLPVITTMGTPWQALVDERCGWWVPLGGDHLLQALREALALSPEHLAGMGQRGRSMVERDLSWPKIASKMSQAYAWLMGDKTLPDCVQES